MKKNDQYYYAKGNIFKRIFSAFFLLPAWFSPHTKIRVFFHKLRGVRIGNNVEIGYFVIIGNVNPDMIIIGDGATITARCTILEHDNSLFYTNRGDVKFGITTIGKNSFIGIGSVILPGVSIGEQAIIGALSLVNKNIPANGTYGGVPAKNLVI